MLIQTLTLSFLTLSLVQCHELKGKLLDKKFKNQRWRIDQNRMKNQKKTSVDVDIPKILKTLDFGKILRENQRNDLKNLDRNKEVERDAHNGGILLNLLDHILLPD